MVSTLDDVLTTYWAKTEAYYEHCVPDITQELAITPNAFITNLELRRIRELLEIIAAAADKH